jgi:hypothetical protein
MRLRSSEDAAASAARIARSVSSVTFTLSWTSAWRHRLVGRHFFFVHQLPPTGVYRLKATNLH